MYKRQFHGSAAPCIDAVAVALTLSTGTPNIFRKKVFTPTEFVTWTAFARVEELQVCPDGKSTLTHPVYTAVDTVPSEALPFSSEVDAALYWFA